MIILHQGWLYCADGFAFLQRVTAAGTTGPNALCVDLREFTSPPVPPALWESYLSEDGWYLEVPARMLNDLAEIHGGIVDGIGSRFDLAPLPGPETQS